MICEYLYCVFEKVLDKIELKIGVLKFKNLEKHNYDEMLPVTMGDSSPMFKDKRKRIKLEKKKLRKTRREP